MKVLITGAAGYMGSYLAQYLIKQRHDVRLIDNYYIPSNLTEIEGVIIENRDIRDEMDLSDVDVLFHLAAISGIKECSKNERETHSVNVKGTYNLLKTFKGKIIFASTSAVYGICEQPEITECHPTSPTNFYGSTKLEAETIVKVQDNYTILRFSNIYGNGLFCKRTIVDLFIERALKQAPLEIHGDGKQRRDFVYINDALRSYIQAMNSKINGIYNIGGNEALSINDIAELVVKNYRQVTGYKLEVRHIPQDTGAKWKDFIYKSEKAKRELHYEPLYSVGDEIKNRFYIYKKKVF